MRYCFPNGQLDMYSKEAPEDAPAPLKPWFAIPGPVSNAYSIAFGHWASLEGRGTPEDLRPDTGCCWGGELTCLRWEDKQYFTQPSNRQKASTKAKPSRPDSSRIAARCALSGLPAASFCRVAANAYPTYVYVCRPGALQRRRSPRRKHDEILSAPSSRNSCKENPGHARRDRGFYRYPARLTAFEDLKAVAMGVLRVGVMKLAEHRLPFVRIVIRKWVSPSTSASIWVK